MKKLAVVILCKDEMEVLEAVVSDLKDQLKLSEEWSVDYFLLDDSCPSLSATLESSMGVQIIKGSGRGLGWSYYACMEFLRKKNEFDLICTMDGDGQVDVSEFSRFLDVLNSGVDMVVGSRFLENELINYDYPLTNSWGTKVLSGIITVSTGQKFSDSHGGMRIFKPQVVDSFRFLGGHTYVQETIICAVRKGFKVKEVPSVWKERQFGESKVVRSKKRYISKMAIPLLLRSHLLRYFLVTFIAVTALSSHYALSLSLGAVLIVVEFTRWFLENRNFRWVQNVYAG